MTSSTAPPRRVVIFGATHGDEWAGAYLVERWQREPRRIERTGLSVSAVTANPKALASRRRYVDRELSGCFGTQSGPCVDASYEASRARELREALCGDGSVSIDVAIDLHTTTANMGLTLVMFRPDRAVARVAMRLRELVQGLRVFMRIKPGSPGITGLARHGITLEAGPVAPNTLRADVLERLETAVRHVLDILQGGYDEVRGHVGDASASLDVFVHREYVRYPRDAAGAITAVVHPELQDRDFLPLQPGDPLFWCDDGTVIHYTGARTTWPTFINETAYYENNIAMSLTDLRAMILDDFQDS